VGGASMRSAGVAGGVPSPASQGFAEEADARNSADRAGSRGPFGDSAERIAGRASVTVPGRAPSDASATAATDIGEPWSTLIGRLELGGAARQLASNCQMVGRQGSVIRLALDARNKHMRTPAQEEKLAQALSRHFNQPIRLEFEMASGDIETPAQADQRASMEDLEAARRAFESDPGVQGLKERFGATLLPETIRPVK